MVISVFCNINITQVDPDVAAFDIDEGKITGVKEDITQIVVKTKDGKHKAYCAVIVATEDKINFNEFYTGSGV